ncbi:MAG TPA: glycosyltransferase family 4 protein [Candidatus Saccharimonadales bacterium]|nr:glycosyltransferase family 4 protein [Candidatus Saccharimonadales bacterium]
MNILWLAWKDFSHPKRGGAEVVLQELTTRQAAESHTVTLLTAKHPGSQTTETLPNGVHVIRIGGNRYTHPLLALLYYLRHLRGTFDVVIETVNTAPYFSLLFLGKAKGIALYHQLAREIWHYETKPPVSFLGYYIMEPLATWLLGRSKAQLVTVSESTKRDLAKFGWDTTKAYIISEGICVTPLTDLKNAAKWSRPTMLSFGAVRAMKRTLDQVKAFEVAKQQVPDLQLKIAGDVSGDYGRTVLDYIAKSPYHADITCLGRVTEQQKIDLMRRSHIITVTSVKEGWGLIVTEAASQGTPAVVYDVDGLRDSVIDSQTGIITRTTPKALAAGIVTLLGNPNAYRTLQYDGWEWSKRITFDQSYKDLKRVLKEANA